MNAITRIQERKAARTAERISRARTLATALTVWADECERRMDDSTRRAMWDEFAVCNAAIALVDDGDFLAQRESLMFELRCDEEGYPDDAPAEFNPSMVHPDDPCQRKGWGA